MIYMKGRTGSPHMRPDALLQLGGADSFPLPCGSWDMGLVDKCLNFLSNLTGPVFRAFLLLCFWVQFPWYSMHADGNTALGIGLTTTIPAIKSLRHRDCCEFWINLCYKVDCRSTVPLFPNTKQQQKQTRQQQQQQTQAPKAVNQGLQAEQCLLFVTCQAGASLWIQGWIRSTSFL